MTDEFEKKLLALGRFSRYVYIKPIRIDTSVYQALCKEDFPLFKNDDNPF